MLVDRIAIPVPTFGEYIEKLKDQRDAELFALDPEQGYALRPGTYLDWAQGRGVRSLLVINPGNPTGQFIPLDEMIEFLRRAKDMELVVVDESFIDFAGDPVPSVLSMAHKFSNLLVIRSMSKHCGIPGLRLGYCYSENLYVLNRLRRYIPTWNLNTLAQYFLSQLAATDADYHAARKRLIGDVSWLYEALCTIPGIAPYPTGANFVLFKLNNGLSAAELQARLLNEHRMYVRDCSNKLGMDTYHVRVASQGREKDAQLVTALRALMQ
jgi:threonine-phosphate decarboxylase